MRSHSVHFMMIKTRWNSWSLSLLIALVLAVVAAWLGLHFHSMHHGTNQHEGTVNGLIFEPTNTHIEFRGARGSTTLIVATILNALLDSEQWDGGPPHVLSVQGSHDPGSTEPSFWAASELGAEHSGPQPAHFLALTVNRRANAHRSDQPASSLGKHVHWSHLGTQDTSDAGDESGSASNEPEQILVGCSHPLTHEHFLGGFCPTHDLVTAAYHMARAMWHLLILAEDASQLAHGATDASMHIAEAGGTPLKKHHPVITNHHGQSRRDAFLAHSSPVDHWAAAAHHIRHALLHVLHVFVHHFHGIHLHCTDAGEVHGKCPHLMDGHFAGHSVQRKVDDVGVEMGQRRVGVREAVFSYGTRCGIPGTLGTGAYRRTVHGRESWLPDMQERAWGLGYRCSGLPHNRPEACAKN